MSQETDAWEYPRELIGKGEVQMRMRESCVNGTRAIFACIEPSPVPLGRVYYRHVGNETVELLSSFVMKGVRRCGLRTMVHDWMTENLGASRYLTGNGTDDGEPWLESTGFEQDERGDWILDVELEEE